MTHTTIRETARRGDRSRHARRFHRLPDDEARFGEGIFSTCGPAHVYRPQVRLSTLRLIALVVGRIVIAGSAALDEHPRVIVVAVITGATVCGDHLYGLLRLLQLVSLACHRSLAIGVPRHHPRCRLIVTPSPLPPSDLRSSG